MPEALLQVERLSRQDPLSGRNLLDDVSLDLLAGLVTALVGASGSGKTLLLRAAALLDPVDAGQVRLLGRTPRRSEIPDFRRRAVYLHQRPALSGRTVEEALRAPLELGVHRERPFDREGIVRRLEQLGRDATFLAQAVADLSGGESQIAALLRALQLEPSVLLLDEPTAALDPTTARAVERLLLDWIAERPERRAIGWVGHDVEQVDRVAASVFVMDQGSLAPVEEVDGPC